MLKDFEQPQLWIAKRHVESGVVFEEPITDRMLKGWSSTPLNECMFAAETRLGQLNEKLAGQWEYAIVGWRCGEVIEVRLW